MSSYLVFVQTLKNETPEPKIQSNTQTHFNTESDGAKTITFDAGQGMLTDIMTRNGITGNVIIDNFRSHFSDEVKGHDPNDLEKFLIAVRYGLETEGVEFIHTATDGSSRRYPSSYNIVEQIQTQLNNFERFVQFAIVNKLTVQHVYA